MITAVLDTNVLVSALISPGGNEALLIEAVRDGFVQPVFSAPIMREYQSVLGRSKLGLLPAEVAALLDLVRQLGNEIAAMPQHAVSPDPGDTKFLWCAMTAGADVLVTGNARHFPDAPYGRTFVLSAGVLIDTLTHGA